VLSAANTACSTAAGGLRIKHEFLPFSVQDVWQENISSVFLFAQYKLFALPLLEVERSAIPGRFKSALLPHVLDQSLTSPPERVLYR